MSDRNGDGLPAHIKRYRDRRGSYEGGAPYQLAGVWHCEKCGRRTDEQGLALADQEPGRPAFASCGACLGGMLNMPDAKDPGARMVLAARGERAGRRRKPRLSEILEDEVRDQLDRVFQPYFDILNMEPNPDWSERTKLDFKQGQVSVSEKLLNRIDGLPTQRIRNVDKDDNDVPVQINGLPTVVQERLLASLFTGDRSVVERVRADIESTADETEEDQP